VYLPETTSEPSQSLPAPLQSSISKALANGEDRGLMIIDPLDALTVRLDMIDLSESSLDAQYFIWQNDPTGILVIRHMLLAADRGVRVRVLVDDIQLKGLVDRLAALDDHPNIEIRLFNPFSVRLRYQLGLLRLAEFAIDGNRLNHRMHNKLIVADNHIALLGGRNIGDDYFGFSKERAFVDSDLLISGEVVPDLSSGFDRYWNSRWAYPVSALVSLPPTPRNLSRLRARIDERLQQQPDLLSATAPSERGNAFAKLRTGPPLITSAAIVDDPDVSWFDRPEELAAELTAVAESAQHRVLVVSPYLVLSPALLEVAQSLISRGVKIAVLTNSLASNDVVIAHAAYARYRQKLLENGIELYEFRHDAAFGRVPGAKYSSLHAKYILFDDDVIFLGSMNLDPRSLYLNTELGVVLRSPRLAGELNQTFETMIEPDNAWRVTSEHDGLRWTSSAGILEKDPARGEWQRVRSAMLSLLPLSNQM
jgi:putative cardiolipin synthase